MKYSNLNYIIIVSPFYKYFFYDSSTLNLILPNVEGTQGPTKLYVWPTYTLLGNGILTYDEPLPDVILIVNIALYEPSLFGVKSFMPHAIVVPSDEKFVPFHLIITVSEP